MFDPSNIEAFGIPLLAMAFGLTEFFKSLFKLEGKVVTLLAAGMALLVFIPIQLIGLIAEPYAQVVQIVYTSVVFGLTASGFYKFVTNNGARG